MKDLIIKNINDIEPITITNYEGKNSFMAKPVIPWEDVSTCSAAFIEVPVGKCSYVNHWHNISEEVFYIISGKGKLRTFYGEKDVKAGDMICFPTGEKGVHHIANACDVEPLIYIDFATNPKVDIAIEPDTNQVAIYGTDIPTMTLDIPNKWRIE
ncbi:MAG: cupin domain-containing protein [Defluviitaleaceae bacterium]|nr:cupin domain-containing protein [Defluviitaleaceae bacterium]